MTWRQQPGNNGCRDKVGALLYDETFSFEQKCKQSEGIHNILTENELAIVEESTKLTQYRLMRLLYQFFSPIFGKHNELTAWKRIVWFMSEMDNLHIQLEIEDSEWNHNRNEDDPDFDDFKWWNSVDKLVKQHFPTGVFTKESWEKCEDYFFEKEAEVFKDYYKHHPEEWQQLEERANQLRAEIEAEKRKAAPLSLEESLLSYKAAGLKSDRQI